MTEGTPRHPCAEDQPESEKGQLSRREFMQSSASALAAVLVAKTAWLGGTAEAAPLRAIVRKSEADVYYRDRLPDYQSPFDTHAELSLFDWDFPSLVTSAENGTFGRQGMPEKFSTYTTVPAHYVRMPIAIIGAGAAGLAAGYELMKLGFEPHFYEMQTQDSPKGATYSRPNGKIYSWDFGGNGRTAGAGAGWYPSAALSPSNSVASYENGNVHHWGRRVAELGGMRYPATHLTLRTYTDIIFNKKYYYGTTGLTSSWVPMRDPGVYRRKRTPKPDRGGYVPPSPNDTLIFDTVYHTKGIFADRNSPNPPTLGGYAQLDRVKAGTRLAESNAAIQNLTFKFDEMLFGDKGILTPILTLYSQYTKDPGSQYLQKEIAREWKRLVKEYDSKSLGVVLSEAGWDNDPAYGNTWGDLNISLSEMFGEIGTGTGPFEVFFYSSFVEVLRVALQAADSDQDYFLGGSSYMLQPFLTNFVPTATSPQPTCLWNETQNRVITDKVMAIEKDAKGVKITTQNEAGQRNTKIYTAVLMTASPSAMRATDIFPNPGGFIPSRTTSYIKRVRINNDSKIAVNFPNIASEPYSGAFWMNRSSDTDTNANNDAIVTTLTDKTIRQIYTFDNYYWATEYDDPGVGGFAKQGMLLLNYGWDYNAQSWTASDEEDAVRNAWRMMTDIYGFGTQYDNYLEWALKNKQAAVIVWEKIDGFNAGFRMAQPGRATEYGDNQQGTKVYATYSELQSMQVFGMSSYNPEISAYTGLFIAGEASASPGLSGWVEGSIQTALQSVAGIIKYLNVAKPERHSPSISGGTSFALQAHPGTKLLGDD
jgi:tryptophan 2-monooxygenase